MMNKEINQTTSEKPNNKRKRSLSKILGKFALAGSVSLGVANLVDAVSHAGQNAQVVAASENPAPKIPSDTITAPDGSKKVIELPKIYFTKEGDTILSVSESAIDFNSHSNSSNNAQKLQETEGIIKSEFSSKGGVGLNDKLTVHTQISLPEDSHIGQ
jgi:hypothetical protein